MDKLQLYLEVVPLPLVAGVGFLALMIYLIIPAESRFYLTFILMPAWLVASRCPDLGFIQAFTKITSGLLFLLIGLAAVLRPVPKRRVPGIAWFYLLGAGYMMMCLIGVSERVDSIVIEIQWIFLILAGMAIVTVLTTMEDIQKVLWALGIGVIIALAIPFSSILLNPQTAFIVGMNRFAPWGSPANLMGLLFVIAGPIILYMLMSSKSHALKPFLIVFLLINIGMAILTGSRMTVFSLIVSLGLMALPLVKRPGLLITGGVIGVIILPLVLGVNQEAAARLGDLSSSGRLNIWFQYFKLSFTRPLGLLGTSGLSVEQDPMVGEHPHSSWFEMLYLGGWPYLIMMAAPAVIAARATLKVWKNRRLYITREHMFLVHALAALIASLYFQSLFNQALYHPTYTLSFMGVMLTLLFVSLESELPYQQLVHDEWVEELDAMESEEDAWDPPQLEPT